MRIQIKNVLTFLTFFVLTFVCLNSRVYTQNKKEIFFNETFQFNIVASFLTVGNVFMKTRVQKNTPLIKIFAKVTPFSQLKYFYHIEGNFGGYWNYVQKKPVKAFEEVYQGKKYQKRFFKFEGDRVLVQKLEKTFSEYSYPHKGKVHVNTNEKKWITAKGFQDLLGSFYYIRTLRNRPKKGDVIRLPVLPAGSKKILVLKILGIYTKEVPFFERKRVMHVKSALASPNSGKIQKGGELFLNTKSQIEMLITDDEHYVPVEIWSKIDYIGKIKLELDAYQQGK